MRGFLRPLPYGRGSDRGVQSRDRKGAGNPTLMKRRDLLKSVGVAPQIRTDSEYRGNLK